MHPLPSEPVERFRSDLERLGAVPERIGVAVSGGPDSLALLLLVSSAFPGRIHAATVDHGLRSESAAEAAMVNRLCLELGVPHATLRVRIDTSRASLQRTAREERYRALGEWLTAGHIDALLTAHHAEDQAETLIMRLLRGSGVGGLSGIRASAPFPNADALLLRPLLGWRKDELVGLVEAAGVAPADDPSNRDDRHDRVKVRRLLESAKWLDPIPLSRSAAALADADAALVWTTEQLWAERVSEDGEALLLDPQGLPAELLRRLVLRLLSRLGHAASPPRGEDVMRLIDRLAQGATGTLAGVMYSGGERWRFEPEGGRRRS